MSSDFLVFGKIQKINALSPITLSDIGKSCFVLARIQLRRDFFRLFDAYILFHLIHHSIEVYLKAFIAESGMKFKKEHNLVMLRENLSKLIKNQKLVDMLYSPDTSVLLKALDEVYAENKYGEVGYSIDLDKLRTTYDKLMHCLISSFFEYANREDRPIAKRIECVELTEAQVHLFDYGVHSFKLYVWPSV